MKVLQMKKSFFTIEKGQVFIINPMTYHVFNITEDSKWINILSIKMDEDNPDIFRVKKPD